MWTRSPETDAYPRVSPLALKAHLDPVIVVALIEPQKVALRT